MPVSKAQQKAVHKYVKANYDRQEITMPKGKKETIKAHAESRGESVNAFINRAIDETIQSDKTYQYFIRSVEEHITRHPDDFQIIKHDVMGYRITVIARETDSKSVVIVSFVFNQYGFDFLMDDVLPRDDPSTRYIQNEIRFIMGKISKDVKGFLKLE